MEIQPKDTSKGHFYVSLLKSVLRITAGGALISGFIVHAGILLIVAEVLGIVEELVWAKGQDHDHTVWLNTNMIPDGMPSLVEI